MNDQQKTTEDSRCYPIQVRAKGVPRRMRAGKVFTKEWVICDALTELQVTTLKTDKFLEVREIGREQPITTADSIAIVSGNTEVIAEDEMEDKPLKKPMPKNKPRPKAGNK